MTPGKYNVMFTKYHTWMMFGRRPKLCLTFRIVDPGEFFGVEVEKHYNARKVQKSIRGQNGVRNGKFSVGRSSKFLRDFLRLLGSVSQGRLDRLPMSRFENNVFLAKVETVMEGNDGEASYEIHEDAQYSVIRDLLSVVEGTNASLAPLLSPIPRPIPIPTKNAGFE